MRRPESHIVDTPAHAVGVDKIQLVPLPIDVRAHPPRMAARQRSLLEWRLVQPRDTLPDMPDTKRSIIQVRLTAADKARVEVAAAHDRRTVSAWIRVVVLDALDALPVVNCGVEKADRTRKGAVGHKSRDVYRESGATSGRKKRHRERSLDAT